MSTSSPNTRTADEAERISAELRHAVDRLEAGQGQTPLGDQIDCIGGLRRGPPTIALVAPSDALRRRLGPWLREGGVERPSSVMELTLPLSAAGSATTVRLLAPPADSITAVAQELLARLGDTAMVLWVALDNPPSPEDEEALQLLAASSVAWSAVDLGQPAPRVNLAAPQADAVRLERSLTEAVLPWASEARLDAVHEAHAVRRLEAVLELVMQRQQAELRQLTSRRKREQQQEAPVDLVAADAENRRRIEAMKSVAAAEVSLLSQELRDRGRRAGLRKGPLFGLVEELLANVRPADLDQEVAGKKIRLTLRPDVTDDLRQRVAEGLRAVILADCAEIGARLRDIEAKLAPHVEGLGLAERRLRFSRPDPEDFWGPIDEAMHLQGRYRGEIQKRGFLQRLGEGRRVVFLVLMIGSLFGGFMGFNIRRAPAMGPVFLVLFLGVFLYTFISWRKQEEIVFDDELIRVRDILSSEFARLISDALRERQLRVMAALEELRRDIAAGLDSLQREAASARAVTVDGERKLSRARQKVLDDRVREVQALGAPLQALRERMQGRAAVLARTLQPPPRQEA